MSETTESVESTDVPYKPTPRDQRLEELAAAREARVEAELAAPDETAPVDETPPGDEPETPVVAPVVEPPALDATTQVEKQMRKVKVDGEEIEVSEDDLVASFQKQQAATRRLQEAAQLKDAAAADRAEAARLLAEAQTKNAAPAINAERQQKLREYHDALSVGDVETADKLFDEVMQGRQAPIPDAGAIAQQVAPALKQQLKQEVKQELDNESALKRFETDFKDILEDDQLIAIAAARKDALMAQGKPYAEALFEAGAATREWITSKASPAKPQDQTTTTRAEKLDKKAGILQFPTANAKATSTQDDEPDETPAQIIAQMKKVRGIA